MTTKRRFIKHLPLVLASLALGLGVFVNTSSKRNNVVQQTEAADYYSGITATSGTTLLGQLHDLSNAKHTTYNAYNAISTTNCAKTDPYGSTSYVMDFYSGAPTLNQITSSGTTGWNREHVWCQNLSNGLFGETGAGADIQHLRPTIPKINSDRGNKKYGELNNSGTASTATDANGNTVYGGYYTSSTFQPMDNKKGDAARIIMYLYMHYNKASNVGGSSTDKSYFGTLNFTHVMAPSTESAAIQLLLTWNSSDPVDSIETTRNEEAAKITGCRNPFIDHSEYANQIWGTSNPTASISPSSTSVAVDGTVNLTATLSNVTNSNLITWTSSDTSKATVAKGTTSTSSSVATVTGVAAGSVTIYCKYNDTTIGSATVSVTSSGGSGSNKTIYVADIPSAYSGTSFTSDGVTYACSNINNTSSSGNIQWKSGSGYLYNTTAISGITSILINTGSTGTFSGTIYTGSSQVTSDSGTSYSATNGTSVSINGSPSYFRIKAGSVSGGAKSGNVVITYDSSSTKTLSSISVSTVPTKTSYNVGQYFDPTGLVIRRNYSDSTHDTYSYAGHTSEFTFTPSTSTALTVSNTSITIGYGGKTCSQAITVTSAAPTSITASVNKTYKVGETISTSDITVKDNNNNAVTGFSFSKNNYQFTYADASSGGSNTNKTFSNAVSYSNLTCSLTVSVSRAAYVAPSNITDTITANDLPASGTTYTDFSNVVKSSGAKYAGNTAENDSAIQLRSKNSNSGIVSTTSGGTISSVTITVSNGENTINVYGKNTAYSAATDLYNNSTQGTLVGSTSSTGTITFSTSYTYVGIRSNSGAAYLTSIAITYGSSESAKNIANYIMYADTNGQCTTKLSTAVGYIKNLSADEKTTFQTSSDYVISTARTRLEAWATSQGKVINYSTGTLSNAVNSSINFVSKENNSKIIMVVILATVGMSTIGACLFIRRKRVQ